MIAKFAGLTDAESTQLVDAIPLITILIAGADGDIDPTETEWAEKLTKIRQYDYDNELNDFYKKVGEGYSDRVSALIAELPGDTDRRVDMISDRLGKLNNILAKIDKDYAVGLISSFKTFANHVAKASGGFFGFGAVSNEEHKLIDLPMINPIAGEL